MENTETTRLPGEVVETYSHADPREVVEVYSRPLPWEKKKTSQVMIARKGKKGLWIFLICVAVIAVLAVVAITMEFYHPHQKNQNSFEQFYDEEDVPEETFGEITMETWPTGQDVHFEVSREHGASMSAADIYRKVNPAVVQILVQLDKFASMGTGVIFREDGYLLTNYHVVQGGKEGMVVTDSGYTYKTQYVAGDPEYDLAVLKIEGNGFPVAEFADSDLLSVGDPAYAIGNPLTEELWGTMTDGIISAIDRELDVDGNSMQLIQTSAALNSGNSGGPLINEYGQVVGINVIKMSSSHSSIEGLGFAIPTAVMRRVVNDLLTFGEVQPEPLLGISVLKRGVATADGRLGLKVESVVPGGAGDLAGIRADDILLTANDEPLKVSGDLLRVRSMLHVGDTMEVTLVRGNKDLKMTLQLDQSVETD